VTELPIGCRVAAVRLRSLGDCVLTTPALDILKRARPDLRIAVVVEDRFRAVFERNPDIETLLGPSWRELRAWSPEFCLNLHGGSASARLTALSGSRLRGGFAHYRWQSLYASRARSRFWAKSGPCILPNIWHRRCFIWARRAWRFRAPSYLPPHTPSPEPTR
jgi:ADP-heptose:LPS heptosyltransferase